MLKLFISSSIHINTYYPFPPPKYCSSNQSKHLSCCSYLSLVALQISVHLTRTKKTKEYIKIYNFAPIKVNTAPTETLILI